MFSCEFCKLFRNTYFVKDLQTSGSETLVRVSLLNKVCKPGHLNAFNSIKKRLKHRYFSVTFVKFFGKFFCRTPPSNNFSHDTTVVVFFFLQISEVCNRKSVYLVEQW